MNLEIAILLFGYFVLLFHFILVLLPQVRRRLRTLSDYENNVHFFIIFRQILLFLAPLMVSIAIFDVATTLQQLTGLIVIGLSINVFWVVQLPLLTKAQLSIDFGINQLENFYPTISLCAETEYVIYTRIYNTGFSTLKNAMVLIYFGKGFEIIPAEDPKYDNIDFKKYFSVQKGNCGVGFVPTRNFQTLTPQEWFIFPVIVKSPKKQEMPTVEIQLSSENSWGMTKCNAKIEIK
jgi:hypothetical protein